ncbi:cadherin repeat domain-containing protein, partial [Croceicoccus sp. F390]
MAEQDQAPGMAAAQDSAASQAATAQQDAPAAPETASYAEQMTTEQAAMAATAEQAPVEVAAAEKAPARPVKVAEADIDKEKDEKDNHDTDGDAAPVDLALDPAADILAAVAEADGARAVPGAEGEASALMGGGSGAILGLAAVAAAGAGIYFLVDDNDDDLDVITPPPAENQAPVITSGDSVAIDENSDVDDVIYTVTATDADGDDIVYTLGGDDAAAFRIDSDTGEIRFVASPDFEAGADYDITVVATDSEGNATSKDVSVTINDLDDGDVT